MKKFLVTLTIFVIVLLQGCGGSGGGGSVSNVSGFDATAHFTSFAQTMRAPTLGETIDRFGIWLSGRHLLTGREHDLWPARPEYYGSYDHPQTQNGYARIAQDVLFEIGYRDFVIMQIDFPTDPETLNQYDYFKAEKWLTVCTDKRFFIGNYSYTAGRPHGDLGEGLNWRQVANSLCPDWTRFRLYDRHLNVVGGDTK